MAQLNPYEAPQSDVSAEGAYPPLGVTVDASKGARLVTLLIDWFAILVIMFGIGIAMAVFDIQSDQLGNVLGWAVMIGYYVGFEFLISATPGKLVTRTRVVGEDGSKPSLLRIFGRTLMRFVPFEPFSLAFGDRAWHDSASRTRVVRRF